jgi:hypothetical protein
MTIRRIRRITSLGLVAAIWIPLALLAACVSTPTPAPKPAVAPVSAAEATLAAAGRVILACYAVPACSAVAPKPKIKADYDAAYSAVTAAQTVADAGGSPEMTAASAALALLQADVAPLPTPKSS